MNQAYLSECGDGQERQKHLFLPCILSVRWVLQLCQCLIVDARLTNNTALIFWPVSDGDNEFYYPGPGGVGGGCHYFQTHDVSTHSLDWPERRPGQIIQSRLFNCSNSQGREPSSERGEALSGESGVFSVSGPLVLTSCGLSSDADTRVWSEARVNREQRGDINRPRHITHTPGNNWGGLTNGKMYL